MRKTNNYFSLGGHGLVPPPPGSGTDIIDKYGTQWLYEDEAKVTSNTMHWNEAMFMQTTLNNLTLVNQYQYTTSI